MTKAQIPFTVFNKTGEPLHFAHANGFPPEAYEPFLTPFFEKHKVIASKFRPLWGEQAPNQLKRWELFADDMIRFLDEQGLKNITGMGHSLGGVSTMIAAIKRPDLFSKVIVLDPVVFKGAMLEVLNLLPISFKKKVVPIVKIAQKRKDTWTSKAEVYESWRSKRVFQKITDDHLKLLIEHAVVSDGSDQVRLAYSKWWEAQVYASAPIFFNRLKNIGVPLIVARGAKTDVIKETTWSSWQQKHPNHQFINLPEAGHLLPLERPEALAKEILALL